MRVIGQSPDPLARMHTMTKRQGKSGTIDIKAILAEDEEFLRGLVRMALQEVGQWPRRTTQPLRSSPITGPSSLLRAAPPLRSASVLSPSRLEPLAACPFTSSA